jgi:hypothetical protein
MTRTQRACHVAQLHEAGVATKPTLSQLARGADVCLQYVHEARTLSPEEREQILQGCPHESLAVRLRRRWRAGAERRLTSLIRRLGIDRTIELTARVEAENV